MKNLLSVFFLCAICFSCAHNSETEKYQSKRDNIVNVREKVKEIETGDVLIGPIARVQMVENYLIIIDVKSLDKLIRLFDKNSFHYITGVTRNGQGPGEIIIIGHLAANEANGKFYVTDHGKLNIFSYDLDSVLADTAYMPNVKLKLDKKSFPDKYYYFNDTLCMGRIIEFTGNKNFKQHVAKWNMQTGEIIPMKYSHPKIRNKSTLFAASAEHDIYVETYERYDLLTICSFNGDLKYNIYGPKWDKRGTGKTCYYGIVRFCNDKIVAAYSGGNYNNDEYFPTKFFIFDLDGNYLKTLDVGYKIYDFCFDKENNRIIMSLNDMIQFAYLDLDGLI
ncbi:MAG: 6-bladed beta-propeller [Firmicutes bacterium]|nr:6-bladed beta-propeller [Bacillota bacterium]